MKNKEQGTYFSFRRLFLLLCIIFSLVGCNSKKKQLTELVEKWQGKEILLPQNAEMKLYGRDTVCPDFFEKDYKILNYVDTNGCTECRLKLYDWQLLKEETDSLQLNVSFIFVAWVKDYPMLEKLQKANGFDSPILYDRTGQADSLNHFPSQPGYQTFLLDKDNRVVLIGNPIGSQALWNLYKKIMTKK